MPSKTITTLAWASALCLIPGMLAMSPSAAFLLSALSAVLAVFPAIMAKRRLRIAAIVLLCAAVLLAVESFPGFCKESKTYRIRSMDKQAF